MTTQTTVPSSAVPKDVDDKLQEFVRRLSESASSNLLSVILYGSAVSGDFDPKHSNLNVFCVLRECSYVALQAIAPAAEWWKKQKQPAPLLMTPDELESTTDVFTIEFLDMKQHYRVLFGDDPLRDLNVPLRLHRAQVEYELREKLVLLRQRALLATKDDQIWDLLLQSAPSFATLFRHALLALGQQAPTDRRRAIDQLSQAIDFDPKAINHVLDVRQHKLDPKTLKVKEVFAAYLSVVEKVTAAVDKALDPSS